MRFEFDSGQLQGPDSGRSFASEGARFPTGRSAPPQREVGKMRRTAHLPTARRDEPGLDRDDPADTPAAVRG